MAQHAPGITPYLPTEAYRMAKAHENQCHMPVFTWAMIPEGVEDCPNCGGGGIVYMRLAERGPFGTPTTSKVVTWFDGDGKFRKGWYIVKETMAFPCPKCQVIVKPSSPMKP